MIYVESWAAIFQGAMDEEPRRFGACLEDSVIPASYRRRLNTFGRMAVSCGLSVAGADTSDLVFCSRYGDIDLAYSLLKTLGDDELMSPAAFSLSVHNAVPGVMDLVRKSQVGHTAIAAGRHSFSAGLTEAWGKINSYPQRKVILVFAESALPDELKSFSDVQQPGQALAMTLSGVPTEPCHGRICLVESNVEFSDMLSEQIIQKMLDVWASGSANPVCWKSRGCAWSFQAGSDAAH